MTTRPAPRPGAVTGVGDRPRYRLRRVTGLRGTFTATELVGECGHTIAVYLHHEPWLDNLVGRRKRCPSCLFLTTPTDTAPAEELHRP